MYNLSNELMDAIDILALKLINKKITFLSQTHWSEVVAAGREKAPWQMVKLTPAHRNVLDLVDSAGCLQADDLRFKKSVAEVGKIGSKLEERLLIFSESVHTESGKHIRVLKSWDHLLRERKFKAKKITPEKAMQSLESLADELKSRYQAKVKLPWS